MPGQSGLHAPARSPSHDVALMHCPQTLALSLSHEKPLLEILQKSSVSHASFWFGDGGGGSSLHAEATATMRNSSAIRIAR